jgi:tRNA A58 N-methylase Trm61
MDVDEAADKAAGADEVDANGEAASGEAGGEAGGEASAVRGGEHNPRKILTLRDAALSEVAAQGFTSLVVAVREAPAVAILELLARLVPGSPFVVYHPSITPLAECLHVCQQSRAAVRLQRMETWARKYQVADLRTHPEMNAYPATGYVLSGVAVLR